MAKRKLFNQMLLLVLFHMRWICSSQGKELRETYFELVAEDYRLEDHVIFEEETYSLRECLATCASEEYYSTCKSMNFQKSAKPRHKCQLNSATMPRGEPRTSVDEDYDYYEITLSKPRDCNPPKKKDELPKGKNCAELRKNGYDKDGVFEINLEGQSLSVRCDMTTDGGGWTVFQRRVDGSVDFYRGWDEYKNGFGDLNGEFWLGLDNIHNLTKSPNHNVLRIDLGDFANKTRYAVYDQFYIEDESDDYKLILGNYSGTAGDSLQWHGDQEFSTKDRDNDSARTKDCAQLYRGAWWYRECHASNLNGPYVLGAHTDVGVGVNWAHWKGNYYSLKKTEMKIRPSDFVE